MSWIKDFRLRYGLTQSQLALFAGITRTYLSVLELRSEFPPALERLFTDLDKEFEKAVSETADEPTFKNETKYQKHLYDLRKLIERKESNIKRLEKELKKKESRYKNLVVIHKVCNRWLNLYKDKDPLIHVKTASLLSGQEVELITCGPEARSRIRLSISRVRSEIQTAKEEYENFSQSIHT